MHKKDYYVALALAVVAGFVGGSMAGRIAAPDPAIAQTAPMRAKIIEAEGFRLVDPAGKIRAVFEIGPDGSVGLHLGNKDGKLRARFAVDGNGLVVLDLKNERSESHAVFYVTAAGSPSLILTDKNGRVGALLGEGALSINREAGITEERPTGSLILLNKEGKVIWRAP